MLNVAITYKIFGIIQFKILSFQLYFLFISPNLPISLFKILFKRSSIVHSELTEFTDTLYNYIC